MNRYLMPGDVFKVEKGMMVIANIPAKYVYLNKLLSNTGVNHVVEVGKTLFYSNNNYVNRREDFKVELSNNLFKFFGIEISSERLLEAMNVLLPIYPCFDPYDTDYLIGEYVVDGCRNNKIQIHNTDYGTEYCVQAHKIGCENQKIEFAQSGISEALILPKNVVLIREQEIYE